MYIDLSLFLQAEYLSLFRTRFRFRRWAYIFLFTGLFWLMWLIVAFGRMLDQLLFSGFKRQALREPVFIIAPPRSGTTLLQKLMSLDEERFVHNKLYQTIFPAVSYQRLLTGVVWLDRHTGRRLGKMTDWAEKHWFSGWDEVHRLRFDQPGADAGFFVYTFVTEAIYLLFPHIEELWEAGFHDALPPDRRRKLMRY
jgi:hypothetical protein